MEHKDCLVHLISDSQALRGRNIIMYRRRGFTLVELLVVIAIIALLMSILMPAMARVKKQARAVMCQTNLRQWGICFQMYAGDNDGYFMHGWVQGGPNLHTQMWMEALRSCYGDNGDIRCCPMATRPGTSVGAGPLGGAGTFYAWGVFQGDNCGEAWSWPSVTTCDYGSYGGNGYVYNPDPKYKQTQGSETAWNWRKADVRGTGYIPLFLDAQWWDGWPRHDNEPPRFDGQHWANPEDDMMKRFCLNRHDGYVNSAFLDFSVRKVGLKELWKLKWHRVYDFSLTPPPEEFDQKAPWMKKFKYYE